MKTLGNVQSDFPPPPDETMYEATYLFSAHARTNVVYVYGWSLISRPSPYGRTSPACVTNANNNSKERNVNENRENCTFPASSFFMQMHVGWRVWGINGGLSGALPGSARAKCHSMEILFVSRTLTEEKCLIDLTVL